MVRVLSGSIVLVLLLLGASFAMEMGNGAQDDSDELLEVTESLRRNPAMLYAWLHDLRDLLDVLHSRPSRGPAKRGIDFGLGRGYSGNQAAKHYMGLVASNYAGGPGKKRSVN